jgi:hypothetical protein
MAGDAARKKTRRAKPWRVFYSTPHCCGSRITSSLQQ